ncbi:MAG: hypothetical protein IIC67_00195 [Thaumarchaeota archaeon]|nr:hypothetical protein [Nitrososphaerota archaeon]
MMIFLVDVRFITLGIDDRIIDTTRNYIVIAEDRNKAELKIDGLLSSYYLSDAYIIEVLSIKQVVMDGNNIGEII